MTTGFKYWLPVSFVLGVALGCVVGIVLGLKLAGTRSGPGAASETLAETKASLLDELIVAGARGQTYSPELTKLDFEAALQYVTSHADHTSFHVLFALRKEFPGVYAVNIPANTKAAVLSSGLARSVGINLWGW